MNSNNISVKQLFEGSDNSPYGTLLRVGDEYILLDCGIHSEIPKDLLIQYKEPEDIFMHLPSDLSIYNELPYLSAIVISHGDLHHIGALPLLVQKYKDTPIYCTDPVGKFGCLLLKEWMEVEKNYNFIYYKSRDLEQCRRRMEFTEYNRKITIPNTDIDIICYQAGRTLGGANWKIMKGVDEMIYATNNDLNVGYLIDGSKIGEIKKPTVMMIDNGGEVIYKQEEERLLKHITTLVERNEDILIPVDLTGRLFEYIKIIKDMKEKEKWRHDLVFVSSISQDDLKGIAETVTEWMKQNDIAGNIFENINLVNSVDSYRLNTRRKSIIFATGQSVSQGTSSRKMLEKLVLEKVHNFNILFLEPPEVNTTAYALSSNNKNIDYDVWNDENWNDEQRAEYEKREKELKAPVEAIKESINDENKGIEESENEENNEMSDEIEEEEIDDRWRDFDIYKDEIGEEPVMFPFYHVKVKKTTEFGDPSTFNKMQIEEKDDSDKENDMEGNDNVIYEEIPKKRICKMIKYDASAIRDVKVFDMRGLMNSKNIFSLMTNIVPRNLVFVKFVQAAEYKKYNDLLASVTITRFEESKEQIICDITKTMKTSISKNLQDLLEPKLDEKLHYRLVSIDSRLEDQVQLYSDDEDVSDSQEKGTELVTVSKQERQRHSSVYVGDFRLKDLKPKIRDMDIDAEIEGGVLICSKGTITIRKVASEIPKIVINGRLSKNYLRIKQLISEEFSVL